MTFQGKNVSLHSETKKRHEMLMNIGLGYITNEIDYTI